MTRSVQGRLIKLVGPVSTGPPLRETFRLPREAKGQDAGLPGIEDPIVSTRNLFSLSKHQILRSRLDRFCYGGLMPALLAG